MFNSISTIMSVKSLSSFSHWRAYACEYRAKMFCSLISPLILLMSCAVRRKAYLVSVEVLENSCNLVVRTFVVAVVAVTLGHLDLRQVGHGVLLEETEHVLATARHNHSVRSAR